MTELITCPFCKLKMKKNDTCSGIWYSHVAHTGCYLQNFIVNEDEVEAWNTRASPWIPISERLPEDNVQVLVTNNFNFALGRWCSNRYWICNLKNITHWQPIEALPE